MKSIFTLGCILFLATSCGSRRNTQTCDAYYGCMNGQNYYANGQNMNAINMNNSLVSFDQLKADFEAKYSQESANLGSLKYTAIVVNQFKNTISGGFSGRVIREFEVSPSGVVIKDYNSFAGLDRLNFTLNGYDLMSQLKFMKGGLISTRNADRSIIDRIFTSSGSYKPRVSVVTKQIPGFGLVNAFVISKSNGESIVVSKDLPYYLNPIDQSGNSMQPQGAYHYQALIQN